MTLSTIIDWCAQRPHTWISGLVAIIILIHGLRRKSWPSLHEAGDILLSFAGLIGGCVVLKHAVMSTEAELRGLAWPLIIGGISTTWISGKSAWERMMKIGPALPAPAPATAKSLPEPTPIDVPAEPSPASTGESVSAQLEDG